MCSWTKFATFSTIAVARLGTQAVGRLGTLTTFAKGRLCTYTVGWLGKLAVGKLGTHGTYTVGWLGALAVGKLGTHTVAKLGTFRVGRLDTQTVGKLCTFGVGRLLRYDWSKNLKMDTVRTVGKWEAWSSLVHEDEQPDCGYKKQKYFEQMHRSIPNLSDFLQILLFTVYGFGLFVIQI